MTLKEQLDAIWNRPGVMFPKHRCWFNRDKVGYRITNDLYVRAGRAVGKGKMKARGKGYSYLCKNYQVAWLWKPEDD